MNRVRHVGPKEKNGTMIPAHDNTFTFYPDTEIIQVREGGGRGYGWPKIEGAGTSIGALRSKDPELFEQLLSETRKIIRALERQT